MSCAFPLPTYTRVISKAKGLLVSYPNRLPGVGCGRILAKDPFDRLLIAQANVEDLPIVSNDPMFPKYTDKVLW
jgi:hypothetical protein